MKNLKLQLLLSCGMLLSLSSYSQWTKVEGVGDAGIYSIASHNGILFSSRLNAFLQSTDDGSSWQPVGQTGFTISTTNHANYIISGEDALYVITKNASENTSMVYKSTDDGKTFQPDTVGLKKADGTGECFNIYRAYYANQALHIVGGFGEAYLKVGNNNWQKVNAIGSAGFMAASKTTLYSVTDKLYVSTDDGVTFNAPANDNLPENFAGYAIALDKATGRIYAAGATVLPYPQYADKLIYTDDEGATWDSIAIGAHLKKNWSNLNTPIKSLYAHDGLLIIGVENDEMSTTTEVLISYDGGTTIQQAVTGLPSNSSAQAYLALYTAHNNYLYIGFYAGGIYKSDFNVGINKVPANTVGLKVYPNPATNTLNLSFNKPFTGDVKLYNMFGMELSGYTTDNNTMDIADLPAGMYLIKVLENNAVTGTQVFIKL